VIVCLLLLLLLVGNDAVLQRWITGLPQQAGIPWPSSTSSTSSRRSVLIVRCGRLIMAGPLVSLFPHRLAVHQLWRLLLMVHLHSFRRNASSLLFGAGWIYSSRTKKIKKEKKH
jgi:hypothetical protein